MEIHTSVESRTNKLIFNYYYGVVGKVFYFPFSELAQRQKASFSRFLGGKNVGSDTGGSVFSV